MISKKKKAYFIVKVVVVVFLAFMILAAIRIIFLCPHLMDKDVLHIHTVKELFISVISTLFVVFILYITMRKEILQINSKALNYAFTDGLTGLYNRHYLNGFLEKFSLMRKEDASFAILFIDIDKFKEVNDTLGHKTGDCILKCLAKKFKSSVRSKDLLCRYGGEEFVIIFSHISKEEAFQKAENIRTIIDNTKFNCEQKTITVSIGLSYGGRCDDINKVLEEADNALYAAKNSGRNCVREFSKKYEN